MPLSRECWILAGPTACGKSAAALELAALIDAEIVSMDSMALYRGMDIGTAKPSPEQRSAVPHHLIDVIDPHQEFSLAEYVAAAEAVCREILARDRRPLFVGGTGLYLRGLMRGVFEGPSADWEFRRRLEDEIRSAPAESIHDRLKQVDPAAAAALHPRDTRRVIRALEVHHLTGRPLSAQQRQTPLPSDARPPNVFWLHPPREWLHERINRRVEEMFAAGLLDEVRRLLSAGRPLSRTARQALGYKETIDSLEQGGSPEETICTIQARTRQFAKRQHTWFRNLEECREVEMLGGETPREIAERLASLSGQTA